ncbi:AAA family ATPase [Streptomyces sp. NPDC050523]|uniref:helix-turn-helix transcriptional regulator n=1 Tax=Streptomyces sp. NPDC050523 TaxID=3365622 RepID=UPI0037B4FAE0
MRSGLSEDLVVGRTAEIALLSHEAERLAAGQGGLLWIEGEPGVGKSTLVGQLIREGQSRGCVIRSTNADEFTGRFPLYVMRQCLGVEAGQSEGFPSGGMLETPTGQALGSRMLDASDRLHSVVERLCADSPLMLVVDDLQWADPESVKLWSRLARLTAQVPLLLVGVLRSGNSSDALSSLREDISAYGGKLLEVDPLPYVDVEAIVEHLVGNPPGASLQQALYRTGGNPLYVREFITLLIWQDEIVTSGGVAELHEERTNLGLSALSAVIAKRLNLLPPDINLAVSLASFLGGSFSRIDLTAVLRMPVPEVETLLERAVAAGVLRPNEAGVSFSHGIMRQILYQSVPEALRYAVHREIAEVLALRPSTPATRVAEHLIAASTADDPWTINWISREAPAMLYKAPAMATELLQRALEAIPANDERWVPVAISLVTVLFRTDRDTDASEWARRILDVTDDVETTAAMRWHMGMISWRRREDVQETLALTEEALRVPGLSALWRSRLQLLQAEILAQGLGDIERGEGASVAAVTTAEEAGDAYSLALGGWTLFYIHISRRDYKAALASVDAALEALRDHDTRRELHDVQMILFDNRMFALQNLDLLDEADATIQRARAAAADAGETPMNRLAVQAAIQSFWTGRWDDARAELDAAHADLLEVTNFGLRGNWPVLLLHGVAALLSAHCDPVEIAQERVRAADDLRITQAIDRDNCDFLIGARALCAERAGAPEEALRIFAPMVDPDFGRSLLKHQWLPDIVRLAMAVGDTRMADRAVEICSEDAARSGTGRARMATARCVGMRTGRTAPLMEAVDHFRRVGRRVEQAWALEDAAAVLAGSTDAGRLPGRYLHEAIEIYHGLGASWDIERAQTRLQALGVQDTMPQRPRPASGISALTPTEHAVARHVARGCSNSEIAEALLLTARTVDVHVTHLMKKLGVTSRRDLLGTNW